MKFVLSLTLLTFSFLNLFEDAHGFRPTTVNTTASYKTCRNFGGSIRQIDLISSSFTVNFDCSALYLSGKFDKEWVIEFLNGTKTNIVLNLDVTHVKGENSVLSEYIARTKSECCFNILTTYANSDFAKCLNVKGLEGLKSLSSVFIVTETSGNCTSLLTSEIKTILESGNQSDILDELEKILKLPSMSKSSVCSGQVENTYNPNLIGNI